MDEEGTLAGPEEPPADRGFFDLLGGCVVEGRAALPPSPLTGGGT